MLQESQLENPQWDVPPENLRDNDADQKATDQPTKNEEAEQDTFQVSHTAKDYRAISRMYDEAYNAIREYDPAKKDFSNIMSAFKEIVDVAKRMQLGTATTETPEEKEALQDALRAVVFSEQLLKLKDFSRICRRKNIPRHSLPRIMKKSRPCLTAQRKNGSSS